MTVSTKRRLKRQAGRKTQAKAPPNDGALTGARKHPGKRSLEEKKRAVLDLLAGKATVEQLAQRLCVLPETVEGWRDEALAGMDEALRQKPAMTAEEKAMEKENNQLKRVVTKLVMKSELLENALETERAARPTRPGKSSRAVRRPVPQVTNGRPTITASTRRRSRCACARAASPVIHCDSPPAVAIFPSSVIAHLRITHGVSVSIQWKNGWLRSRASSSLMMRQSTFLRVRLLSLRDISQMRSLSAVFRLGLVNDLDGWQIAAIAWRI